MARGIVVQVSDYRYSTWSISAAIINEIETAHQAEIWYREQEKIERDQGHVNTANRYRDLQVCQRRIKAAMLRVHNFGVGRYASDDALDSQRFTRSGMDEYHY